MSDFSTNPLKVTSLSACCYHLPFRNSLFPPCFILYDCCRVAKVLDSIIYSKSGSAVLRKKHTLK